MPGKLVLSLDFELLWGVRDHMREEEFRERVQRTREAIPRLLQAFEDRGIHATWATVGFLFLDGHEDLEELSPDRRPSYDDENRSPYPALAMAGASEDDDPHRFAPSLVRQIDQTKGQEIGSHTFSHYYCLEDGGDVEAFEADLLAAQRAAKRLGIELESLVLPRNQAHPPHLEVASKQGFQTYRGNPSTWTHRATATTDRRPLARALRYADAHLPILDWGSSEPRKAHGNALVNVPASRFVRYAPPDSLRGRLRLRRIRREMRAAAKEGGVYHLWWHPHNIGEDPDRYLPFVSRVLDLFEDCRSTFEMESLSMAETAAAVG